MVKDIWDSLVGRDNAGCEHSIYSRSVVPEREAPTMKTGPLCVEAFMIDKRMTVRIVGASLD